MAVVWENVIRKGGRGRLLKCSWTAESDGSVAEDSGIGIAGFISRVVTKPGATAPTAYGLKLYDEHGCDVLGGAGSNRSVADAEQLMPNVSGYSVPCYVNGVITCDISGNTVDSAQGEIFIYIEV